MASLLWVDAWVALVIMLPFAAIAIKHGWADSFRGGEAFGLVGGLAIALVVEHFGELRFSGRPSSVGYSNLESPLSANALVVIYGLFVAITSAVFYFTGPSEGPLRPILFFVCVACLLTGRAIIGGALWPE